MQMGGRARLVPFSVFVAGPCPEIAVFVYLLTALLPRGAPAWAADPPQVLDVLPAEGEIVQGTVTLTVYTACLEGAPIALITWATTTTTGWS